MEAFASGHCCEKNATNVHKSSRKAYYQYTERQHVAAKKSKTVIVYTAYPLVRQNHRFAIFALYSV